MSSGPAIFAWLCTPADYRFVLLVLHMYHRRGQYRIAGIAGKAEDLAFMATRALHRMPKEFAIPAMLVFHLFLFYQVLAMTALRAFWGRCS
jgi:hypothetical protein